MNTKKDFLKTNDSRSEEVQEIISQVPNWLVRWGISLIFLIFLAILYISWFIKYPDIVKAEVTITTLPAPISLVTRNEGHIEILKGENETVKAGDLIAFIQTSTSVSDLLHLEEEISKGFTIVLDTKESKYQLGELQDFLNQFITAEKDLDQFYENDLQNKQVKQLEKQLRSHKLLGSNITAQLLLIKKEHVLANEKFETDSLLFKQGVIAKLDFNISKSNYLQQLRAYRDFESSLINNRILIEQLEKQIQDIQIDKEAILTQLQTVKENSLKQLIAQIKKWKQNYLFISPTEGTIAQLGFIEDGQFVESGLSLFSIIPNTKKIYGQAVLPIQGSGKVKQGQHVNIRLQNYPSEQFGMLSGVVESLSLVPTGDKYFVKISMPQGMQSTYNQEITFKHQLKGETEIITEDLRLLDRFFYQIRKLLQIR